MKRAIAYLQNIACILQRGVQIALALALLPLAIYAANNLPSFKVPEPPPVAEAPAAPAPEPQAKPLPAPTPTPTPASKASAPAQAQEVCPAGDPTPPASTALWPTIVILLALAVFARIWLRALMQGVRDSNDFAAACQLWSGVIAHLFASPREVKRWINRVRYINARMRKIIPAPNYWQRIHQQTQNLRHRRGQPYWRKLQRARIKNDACCILACKGAQR